MTKLQKPTDGELEILQVLWEQGEASVRTVHETICLTKDAGYTTTLKLMQIMLEKNMVSRDSSSKIHIYKAIISKESAQKQMVGKMISRLFSGSSKELVLEALGNHRPGKEELAEIEAYIQKLKSSNQ